MKKEWKLLSFLFVIFLVFTLLIDCVLTAEIRVTQEHPFFIDNEWRQASELVVGDVLKTFDGRLVRVVGIKDVFLDEPVDVFNLEAGGLHNFVVEEGLVVHNSGRARYESLEDLINSLDETSSIDDFERALDEAAEIAGKNLDNPSMSLNERLDKIAKNTEHFRNKLRAAGLSDDVDLPLSEVRRESLKKVVNEVKRDLKKFLESIGDENCGYQQVFLGGDGSYLAPAAKKLGADAVVHDINRMMLATPDQYKAAYQEALKRIARYHPNFDKYDDVAKARLINKQMDQLFNVGWDGNIVDDITLYRDTNKVIKNAVSEYKASGCTEGLFDHISTTFGREVMADPANRDRVIYLIGRFVDDVDLTKPTVIVDYAGSTHAQSNILNSGVDWLKDSKNWDSLTTQQRAMLGNNHGLFVNSDIRLKLGIDTNPANTYHGLGLNEIWETPMGIGDFVEQYRPSFMNPDDLLTNKLEIGRVPNDARTQAVSYARAMAIIDAMTYKFIYIIVSKNNW